MTYQPESKSGKEKALSLLFAIVAVALIIISGVTQHFGGLYQISAIIFGVVSIEFYLKYVGSNYIYEAGDDYFKVYKITGKKSICVSSLDYDMSLSHVLTKQEYAENKDKLPKTNFNVNLCKNISPYDYCVYFFEFNGKKCMMKFEPDETFRVYMNSIISKAWEQNENENDDY